MSNEIIKPDPNDDFYIIYSTVVDSVTGWGPLEEVVGILVDRELESAKEEIARRFERVETKGTSSLVGSAVDDEGMLRFRDKGLYLQLSLVKGYLESYDEETDTFTKYPLL